MEAIRWWRGCLTSILTIVRIRVGDFSCLSWTDTPCIYEPPTLLSPHSALRIVRHCYLSWRTAQCPAPDLKGEQSRKKAQPSKRILSNHNILAPSSGNNLSYLPGDLQNVSVVNSNIARPGIWDSHRFKSFQWVAKYEKDKGWMEVTSRRWFSNWSRAVKLSLFMCFGCVIAGIICIICSYSHILSMDDLAWEEHKHLCKHQK